MAKLALLVGVSEYSDPSLNPLSSALKDVQAVRTVLEYPQMGGFDNVRVLENPDSQQVEEEIETLFRGRQKDDLLLFYFSGHGVQDGNNRLYFATRDTRKDAKGEVMRSKAVAASFVHEAMNESRSKRQVLILDCCFSGAFAKGMRPKDDQSINLSSQLGGEGRVLLTSSTASQYSFEQQDKDLSVYTAHLVNGIWTGEADRDHDGQISIRELHEYTKGKVQETSPNMNPEIYNDKEGYSIFISRAPKVDPILLYRKEVEDSFRRGEISFVSGTWVDDIRHWLAMPPKPDVAISSIGQANLTTVYEQLGLSSATALAIQEQVLQPHRENLKRVQRYKNEYSKVYQRGKELSSVQRQSLSRLQQSLGLSNTDVASVEEDIFRQKSRLSFPRVNGVFSRRRLELLLWVGTAFVSLLFVTSLISVVKNPQSDNPPIYQQPSIEDSPEASLSPSPIPEISPGDKPASELNDFSDQVTHDEERGDNHLEQGRLLDAKDSYTVAINGLLFPDKNQPLSNISDPKERLATLFRKRADVYLSLGDDQPKIGNPQMSKLYYGEAIKDYNQAISKKSDYGQAYEYRGYARLSLGDRQRARADLQKARDLYLSTRNQKGYARVEEELRKF